MSRRSHWEAYHSRWSRLGPPLRPPPSVVAAIAAELASLQSTKDDRLCLLLGVTPELARIHTPLVAVDRNPEMIEALWVGDDSRHRALRGDWSELDSGIGPLGCAVGDGSLNVMAFPHPQARVLGRLRALIPEDGGVILRVFARTPTETRETASEVLETPEVSLSFHGFKWRLAMAMCDERGSTLQVASLWEKFNSCFRDREALATRTGWSMEDVETIDVYASSPETYAFPTRAEFMELAESCGFRARFREVGGYELAARCPLLVLT